jgi:ADP-ribosyl-[dinitrogen reductase] hydrolase
MSELAGGVPDRDRYLGCLLGGAVGDALGGPVEFDSITAIRAKFGPAGVTSYQEAYGRRGAITDDTQMALFTAEGLIRARQRMLDRGVVNVEMVIHRAYLRWLSTQEETGRIPRHDFSEQEPSGWLLSQVFLHHRRAPGNTCLMALRAGVPGTPKTPINDSKGCGGVMRVAPVGLTDADNPFDLGSNAAALTHGHPSGWVSAGALAL